MKLFPLVWAGLWRRPFRSLLTAACIAIVAPGGCRSLCQSPQETRSMKRVAVFVLVGSALALASWSVSADVVPSVEAPLFGMESTQRQCRARGHALLGRRK